MKRILFFAFAAAFLLPALVLAQDNNFDFIQGVSQAVSDPAATLNPTLDPKEIWNVLSQNFLNVFKGSDFTDSGKTIIGYLLVATVAVGAMKLGIGATDLARFLADTTKTMMVGSIAYAAISPMPWAAPFLGGSITLGEFARDSFMHLANLPTNWVEAAVMGWWKVITTVAATPIVPTKLTTLQSAAWVMANFYPVVFMLLLKLLTCICLLVSAVLTIGHLLVGCLTISLALYVAPLVVPWILFKPLSFLFDSWTRMLLIGGFTVVVGQLFRKGGEAFANAALGLVTRINAPTNGDVFDVGALSLVFIGLLFGCFLFIFLAMRITNFAQAIVSGSAVSGFSLMEWFGAGKAVSMLGGGAAVRAAAATVPTPRGIAATRAGIKGVEAAAQSRRDAAAKGAIAGATTPGGTAGKPITPMSTADGLRAFTSARAAYMESSHKGQGHVTATQAANSAAMRFGARDKGGDGPGSGPPPGGGGAAIGPSQAPTRPSAAPSGASAVPARSAGGGAAAASGGGPGGPRPAAPNFPHEAAAPSARPGPQPVSAAGGGQVRGASANWPHEGRAPSAATLRHPSPPLGGGNSGNDSK